VSWYFFFFFISGFCSVLYELVWLRLAMAQFGVTTAMVSIVLSVFMAGLGLGSWASGRWLRGRGDGLRFPALRLYGIVELLIGVSGLVVPYELGWGRNLLGSLGLSSSLAYYSTSGLWVACTLIPWCALMGATIPIAMRSISQTIPREAVRSFSYLYMANVAGAVAGTLIPLLLIELLGFHGTLKVGGACNFLIAICAICVSDSSPKKTPVEQSQIIPELVSAGRGDNMLLVLLFLTGLTSMGMEVVWVRQFTPYLGTVVYAFASILGVYLAATYIGSRVYRLWSMRHDHESPLPWTLLGLFALLPLLTASPGIVLAKGPRLFLGIVPFTGMLGFLTPMLVDSWSRGNPARAGSAYAVNILGCIVGPLFAGFALLPWTSERWALVLLSVPWLILGLRPMLRAGTKRSPVARVASYLLLPLCLGLFVAGKGYEQRYGRQSVVLRDPTATVIATGGGMNKTLLVNGYGMTALTPVTKMMAHFPLAFLDRPPQDALDICFGMGTTFRSLLSWKIQATAVELVPSVPRLFGFFHADGPELLRSPMSHVVIDDGRRYLERTTQQYDLITIDPPPPVEAAGSSLLYSEEFYAAARRRLRPGGILQQWLPYGDAEDFSSVARALQDSFPYVRVFRWTEHWGFHFLASDHPLPNRNAGELARHLPPAAAADLIEWGPRQTAEDQFDMILRQEIQLADLIALSPSTPALRDDRPINEYYTLRHRWRRYQNGTRAADLR
jgi:predicted membrane-bound spermidine synthase